MRIGLSTALTQTLRGESLQIDGYAIGDTGEVGTLYEGYTLSDADDFTSLDLVRASNPFGSWLTGATQDRNSPRNRNDGSIASYYAGPYSTGENDANRGVASGATNITQSGSLLVLQTRRATAGEQALMGTPTLPNVGSGINSPLRSKFYVGAQGVGDIIFEARMKYTGDFGNLGGSHVTLWSYNGRPVDGGLPKDETDIEGNSVNAWLHGGSRNAAGDVTASFTGASPFGIHDDTFHVVSLRLNGTAARGYVDGVQKASHNTNTNAASRPNMWLLTNNVVTFGFHSENYSAAEWAASANGFTITVDYVRVWRKTGTPHYAPLIPHARYYVDDGDPITITVPSQTTIWGGAVDNEYIQHITVEGNSPGCLNDNDNETAPDGLPVVGATWNAGTRELAVDTALLNPRCGRFYVTLEAWDDAGSTCRPWICAIDIGPRWTGSASYNAQIGDAYSLDVYALWNCGDLTSGADGLKAKTITVSGLPTGLSYSDATGLITGTPTASAATYPITTTCTNSSGQVNTANFDIILAAEANETETDAYIAAWASPPAAPWIAAIDDFVAATLAVWPELDRLRLPCLHVDGGLIDLITPGTDTLTTVGTPVFTAKQGWNSNSAGHLQSAYNPGDGGSHAYLQNSASLVVGITGGTTSGNPVSTNAADTARINPRSATDGFVTRLNQTSSNAGAGLATSTVHMFTVTRNGATTQQKYIDSALVESPATASAAVSNSPRHYLIDPTKTLYNTLTLGLIAEGGALTAGDVDILSDAWIALQAAIAPL